MKHSPFFIGYVILLIIVAIIGLYFAVQLKTSPTHQPKNIFELTEMGKVSNSMYVGILADTTTGIWYLVVQTSNGLAITEYKHGVPPQKPEVK